MHTRGKSLRATMENEGAKFFDVPDRQPFIDATAGVYDQVDAKLDGGFVGKLRASAK